MELNPADEHELYKVRPDLWAVTRVLIHCKTESTKDIRQMVWDNVSPEDQSFLKSFYEGKQ